MGKGNKGQKRLPQPLPRRDSPPLPDSTFQGKVAIKRTAWQRFTDFLRGPSARQALEPSLLNDTHDLAEDRPLQGVTFSTSNTADFLNLQKQVELIDASLQKLLKLDGRVTILAGIVEALRKELLTLKRLQDNDPDQKPDQFTKRNYDDLQQAALELPRPSTQLGRSQPRPISSRSLSSEPTVEDFDRAVCQALERQNPAGAEIDSLLEEIRDRIGDFRVEVEYIGQDVTGRWQIAALLLPSTGQGLAIVSPGGLAGPEVVSFFEVEFGRRIFECTQPARIERRGQKLSVLRKGRVESS